MSENEDGKIADAIREHGNQLGGNLVYLKTFLDAQRRLQEEFLTTQATANEELRRRATRAAVFSAVAAIAAAVAAVVQAMVAIAQS